MCACVVKPGYLSAAILKLLSQFDPLTDSRNRDQKPHERRELVQRLTDVSELKFPVQISMVNMASLLR